MEQRSKKDIKAAIDKLKEKSSGTYGGPPENQTNSGKLASKKSSKRIRKQGV